MTVPNPNHTAFRTLAVALTFALLAIMGSGCAAPQAQPVSLHYQVAEREKVATRLSGLTIGVSPFQDGRTDPYLYKKQLVLAEGQDAGIWMANALKLELEHAGATVEALAPGTPPSTGLALTGQVAFLKAKPTGWDLGGIFAALIGTGYMPHITVTVQLHEEAVPILSRQYDLQKNVPSDPGHVLFLGLPPANRDVPAAFATVLKKLIREQLLPDLDRAANEAALTSKVSDVSE